MSCAPIPDDELIAQVDGVTILVASKCARKDVWTLAEALAWIGAQEEHDKITLFRPGDARHCSVWIEPDQIARLSRLVEVKCVA